MIILLNLLLVFLIALVLAAILVYGFGRRGPGPASGFLFFLTMVFLATWVGSVWIHPIGPELWGVPWVPILIIGLIVMLIIAAVLAPVENEEIAPDEEGVAPPTAPGWGCGLIFWLLTAILIVAAIARYTWFTSPLID